MASSCLSLGRTLCLVLFYVQACTCGEVEIINGNKVKSHELPYMALLLNSTGEAVCGGTLLSSRWVLTAAHCSDITTVRLGVKTIKKSGTDKSVQTRNVSESIPYLRPYNPRTHEYDLQLLKLDQMVKLNKYVQHLPLANETADPQEGTECLVAGWGAVNPDKRKMSDDLMSAIVTVISRTMCNSPTYYNRNPVISANMVCAGALKRKLNQKITDTCQGDSGGPLICKGVQVGITSFGKGCGDRTKPGVYTRLSTYYISWIKTKIQE